MRRQLHESVLALRQQLCNTVMKPDRLTQVAIPVVGVHGGGRREDRLDNALCHCGIQRDAGLDAGSDRPSSRSRCSRRLPRRRVRGVVDREGPYLDAVTIAHRGELLHADGSPLTMVCAGPLTAAMLIAAPHGCRRGCRSSAPQQDGRHGSRPTQALSAWRVAPPLWRRQSGSAPRRHRRRRSLLGSGRSPRREQCRSCRNISASDNHHREQHRLDHVDPVQRGRCGVLSKTSRTDQPV